jgi:hypothetical protein
MRFAAAFVARTLLTVMLFNRNNFHMWVVTNLHRPLRAL